MAVFNSQNRKLGGKQIAIGRSASELPPDQHIIRTVPRPTASKAGLSSQQPHSTASKTGL